MSYENLQNETVDLLTCRGLRGAATLIIRRGLQLALWEDRRPQLRARDLYRQSKKKLAKIRGQYSLQIRNKGTELTDASTV